jgi:hypothetical protein
LRAGRYRHRPIRRASDPQRALLGSGGTRLEPLDGPSAP